MARLKKEHRERQILLTALEFARNEGLYRYTLESIANALECSHGTILHHYGSAIGLRDKVIVEAIRIQDLRIIGEAVFKHDPATVEIDASLAARAVNVYVGRQLDA